MDQAQIPLGLSFDDVLIVPQHSSVQSRKDCDTKTKLTNKIELNIPLLSSNMDTVTESKMAIAMALAGGIGIIHQFMSIDEQVEQVKKVKRATSHIIEDPLAIKQDLTLRQAKELMSLKDYHSALIVDEQNKLVGILTKRDYFLENNLDTKIKDLMTKKENLITSHENTTIDQAIELFKKHKIEKLPLVDKDFNIKGLIASKDIEHIRKFPQASKDKKGRLLVGAAVGVKPGFLERTKALLDAGADVIVVDIAHGHSDLAINALKQIKKSFPQAQVIAGNVATAQGAESLIKAGADAIKVGVGPGAACITRIVTGAGVPQITALLDCVRVARKYNILVIADGGVKHSGDIAKAIAAGAHLVMCGSLFAGTDESPGIIINKNGARFKLYRGSASYEAHHQRKERENKIELKDKIEDYTPEGEQAYVPYRGPVQEVINSLIGGLKSGMSYSGATNIEEFHKYAQFVRMTEGGVRESGVHDLKEF